MLEALVVHHTQGNAEGTHDGYRVGCQKWR